MSDCDFDSRYEEYRREAAGIMAREKTARMLRTNTAPVSDPKEWAKLDGEELVACWEDLKCIMS